LHGCASRGRRICHCHDRCAGAPEDGSGMVLGMSASAEQGDPQRAA
jgi:hypothetical protein